MDILNDVENICRRAGEIVRRMLEKDFAVSEKTPGDPVTEIDHAVDAFLKKELMALRPTWGWLSEETEEDASWLDKEAAWVVDPIDGTKNMLSKTREFCISVAVVKDGEPVLGVLYEPMGDVMISANHANPLRVNGKTVKAIYADEKNAKMIVSHSTLQRGTFDHISLEKIALGSVAWRIGNVAVGTGDICLSRKPDGSPWDIAAAHYLAIRAGCVFTDLSGNPICYNRAGMKTRGFIVAPPHLFDLAKKIAGKKNKN